MPYEPDFSHDMDSVYDLETFTLRVEGQEDIALEECVLTGPITTHEMEPTDGQVLQMDQRATWPIYKSPTMPPPGSVLVDSDGAYWTILSVRRSQHVECWKANCRNLDIIPAIANRVMVLKATYSKGRANEASPTWKGWKSQEHPATVADVLEARLQPAAEIAAIRYGAEWSRQTYRLVLKERLDIDLAGGNYLIVDPSGNHYRIKELFNECRLDRFPIAMVVRIVEGQGYFRAGSPGPSATPSFPQP